MDSITLLSGLVIQFYQVPNSDIGVKRLYIFQGQFIVYKLLISSRSNAMQYIFFFVNAVLPKIVTSIIVWISSQSTMIDSNPK